MATFRVPRLAGGFSGPPSGHRPEELVSARVVRHGAFAGPATPCLREGRGCASRARRPSFGVEGDESSGGGVGTIELDDTSEDVLAGTFEAAVSDLARSEASDPTRTSSCTADGGPEES